MGYQFGEDDRNVNDPFSDMDFSRPSGRGPAPGLNDQPSGSQDNAADVGFMSRDSEPEDDANRDITGMWEEESQFAQEPADVIETESDLAVNGSSDDAADGGFDEEEPQDEQNEEPAQKKPGKPNVAILAAAGLMGLAVLGGGGYMAANMLGLTGGSGARTASSMPPAQIVPVPASTQDAAASDALMAFGDLELAPQAPEGRQADDNENLPSQSSVMDEVHALLERSAQAEETTAAASPAAAPATEPVSTSAAAPASTPAGSADPEPSRELAASAPGPSSQNRSAVASPAAQPTQPSQPSQAAQARPSNASAAPRQTAAVSASSPSRTASARPSRNSSNKPAAREVMRDTAIQVVAVYPQTGRFAMAWIRDDQGRVTAVREGDAYMGVRIHRIHPERMEVETADGRLWGPNQVVLSARN